MGKRNKNQKKTKNIQIGGGVKLRVTRSCRKKRENARDLGNKERVEAVWL